MKIPIFERAIASVGIAPLLAPLSPSKVCVHPCGCQKPMANISLICFFMTLVLTATTVTASEQSALEVQGAITVDVAAAKALYDRGVPFIDVRTNDLWKESHILGAHHLELFTKFNEAKLLKIVSKDEEVVIHCSGPRCKRSSKACAKAVQWGFTKVYYFRDGFPAWRAAGYPTDPP